MEQHEVSVVIQKQPIRFQSDVEHKKQVTSRRSPGVGSRAGEGVPLSGMEGEERLSCCRAGVSLPRLHRQLGYSRLPLPVPRPTEAGSRKQGCAKAIGRSDLHGARASMCGEKGGRLR